MVLAYVGLIAGLAQQTYRLDADQTQQASLILTNNALHQPSRRCSRWRGSKPRPRRCT